MSDNYSIDDILAEIENKKSSVKPDINKIPHNTDRHEKPDIKPADENEQVTLEKTDNSLQASELNQPNDENDFSLTNELKMIEERRGVTSGRVDFISNRKREPKIEKKLPDSLSVTSIINDERLTSKKTESSFNPNQNKINQPKLNKSDDFNKGNSIKKNTKPKKGEIVYEKARVLPKPILEEDLNRDNQLDNEDIDDDFSIDNFPNKKDVREKPEYSVKIYNTENSKSNQRDREYKNTIQKPGMTILERDISLENPHELIDGINPYELLKNKEKPAPPTNDDFMSGDTMGIAGNDLKELASRSADEAVIEYTTAEVGVKRYEPAIDNKVKPNIPGPVEKAKRSNTALLESLNKAIKEKRESEIIAQRTVMISKSDSSPQNPIPSNALNIDYKKQIIEDTAATVMLSNTTEQNIIELASKRKRKIRDFVLEDIESDEDESDYNEVDIEDEEDFDSYDSSGQIWKDLCNLHKSLNLRFIILLIITVVLAFITVMNDLQKDMAFSIAGTDILFFDKRYDPTGFLYLNLILGIVGLITCGTVVTGGITRLFKGNGDCDSICSIPAIVSIICVIPQLSNTDSIQRGVASVFVAAGLTALLFNTIGKLVMIRRAKRNFRFISGDSVKYYAYITEDSTMAHALTKGILNNLPVLASMRKTEFLTDFLKNSYCTDMADTISRLLTPIGFGIAAIVSFLAFLTPENNDFYWALTTGCAMLVVLSPLSMMFIVNVPLSRANRALEKSDSVVMGYSSAVDFSETNSILVDASVLFPAGSIAFRNIKRCQQASSLGSYAIDEAIITAASLAIKSGSILTYMFYDMIAGKNELLYDVENCIYEVNMGISGWLGNKRIMLGNREQMKHHGIKVPDIKKERKYCSENGDVVYLAVGGETVSMFFIEIIQNPEIYNSMQELTSTGISVIVRTRDSLVTVNKLADVFDVPPEQLRVLPFDMHGAFEDCTRYTSRGNSAIACDGTFTSFAASLTATKKIVKDVGISTWITYLGLFTAVILGTLFMLFAMPNMFTTTNIILYNLILFFVTTIVQRIKRYP